MEDLIYFRGDLHDVHHDVPSREWFTRVWVLQEIVVSKVISLQCGSRRVPWDALFKAVMLQRRTHDHYGESLRQEDLIETVRRMWYARVDFHLARNQEDHLPEWYKQVPQTRQAVSNILDMLVRARDLMSADPRDKIFALLGLRKDFDWTSNGTIDYGMDAESTYIKDSDGKIAFREEILFPSHHCFEAQDEDGLLPVLNSYYHRMDSLRSQRDFLDSRLREYHDVVALTLPTWVPNWQCYLSALYEPRAIVEIVGSHAPVPSYYQPFNCDNFRKWGIHGGKKALTVHGRVLGTVGLLLSSSCLLGRDERNFERIRQASESQAPSSKALLDAQILYYWSNLLDCSADLETDGDSILENDGRIITLLEKMAASRDALEMKISQHITQIPETLALLPPQADFRDLVVWFPGAKVPFVVRRMPEFPSELYSAALCGQDGNEDNLQTERLSEDLVFVDGTEEHLACELVGECWTNDFEEIARKEINQIMFSTFSDYSIIILSRNKTLYVFVSGVCHKLRPWTL
ncbi:putative Heterokaryon incompatibility domain-containing protein [Seiridium unicorne]|uniref:Heterokaryon incompatibility domain-containing protein n=1 Tax=Seiridium unicorne TaxID=138068 RepID=A0ABR2UMV5_9PEZI